jgi:hypothetical protein
MKKTRAGRTEKISISLDARDVAALRRRAGKLYEGNLSAAIAEGVRRVREEEGREGLVRWLGAAGHATPAERHAILRSWGVRQRIAAA